MKTTTLHSTHVNLGARMVEFAGYEMPVQYESILKEHAYVRNHAGLFDISHMGEILVKGPDSIKFLQKIMTNDLNLLEPWKGQYSCMCYENGTTVDDVFYYLEPSGTIRMIINASNIEKDIEWMRTHLNGYNVEIEDDSALRCRFAFQGPKSKELLNPFVDANVYSIKRFFFTYTNFKGIPIFLAHTGYTGEDGFELSFECKYATEIWKSLIDTGAHPIGLGARDSLRLEACYSLYGHELSDEITPIEASIGWVVKPKKDIDFIGKKALLFQKENGTARTLVGLNLIDRGILREHYKVFKDEEEIGYITSGGYSPTLKKTIGLALIKSQFKTIGTELEVEIRGKLLKAEIVITPFYRSL
ncbi:MAG: glycine cleavage system aminomethyltransferase GcvT [Promethearchaeota archaeon]